MIDYHLWKPQFWQCLMLSLQALYNVAVTISDRTLGFDIWINITTELCVHFRRFQQISSCGDEKSCI